MLRLHLFGVVSFSVDTGDSPAGVPTHVRGRPGCLLAYLALARGRYFSRGELVSVLWPDQPDPVGTGTFNTVLWRLRKLVERPPLAHGSLIACDRRGALGLHLKAPVELDVEAFAQCVLPVLAKPIERMNEADVDALRGGIELYTADILTDLGDEWALREREKHRRHYLNALGRMMQICAVASDNASAIRYAQAILDNDALR
jgi:DNA-binding SARP family transcriptional activator